MFGELFVIFQVIKILKQMQYFVLMQIYQLLVKRGGDNLHMAVTILTWWVIQRWRDQYEM
jgi:hypothetical protein